MFMDIVVLLDICSLGGVSMLLNFKSHITTLLINSAKFLYFTRVAAKFTIISETYSALCNLVSDYPPLPFLILLQPHWSLVILRTCSSHTYLRAFALATPSTEILLPQLLHNSHPHLFKIIIQMLPDIKAWLYP